MTNFYIKWQNLWRYSNAWCRNKKGPREREKVMVRMRCKREGKDRACEKHYRFNTSVRYPLSGSILGIFREVYYSNEDDGRKTGLSAMKRQIETEAGGRSGADTRCKVYEIKAPVKTADSTRASYSPFVSSIVIGTSIFLRNLLLLRERREPVYRKRSWRGKKTGRWKWTGKRWRKLQEVTN